jgi:hypothetical protein
MTVAAVAAKRDSVGFDRSTRVQKESGSLGKTGPDVGHGQSMDFKQLHPRFGALGQSDGIPRNFQDAGYESAESLVCATVEGWRADLDLEDTVDPADDGVAGGVGDRLHCDAA